MARRLALFLPLLAASFLTGCSDPLLESGSRDYDVTRYDVEGAFDWNSSRLGARVDITLTLDEDDLEAVILDSRVDVKAVRIRGAGEAEFETDPERGLLAVSLEDAPGARGGASVTIEIDYEARPSDALNAVPPRKGDPIDSRALYTDAEPLDAPLWMPCHNVPSDRALFSVAMKVDEGESMIANGSLVSDAPAGAGAHRVKYETAWTLPPYLMAFAISDFEVVKTQKGDLPVEVWHRRGLPGEHEAMAGELSRMIGVYEGLLGPYPFERYALVLLPGFPGGMENASVSFQAETSSSEPTIAGDLLLAAHELGHQWFGDLVTVETWDDVWIKEGMANLLEYEAARPHIDASDKGTLNGDGFHPRAGAAIRDRAIPPPDKYNSGPYDRAAWLLTQIRSLLGDEAFFATLREVLDKHRFGAIGTDAFIDAFAPALGPEATGKVRRAVDAKALPTIHSTAPFRVNLEDPDGALVAPLDLSWIGSDGAQRKVTLSTGAPVDLTPEAADLLLLPDPLDRHPDWELFWDEDRSLAEDGESSNLEALVSATSPDSLEKRTLLLDLGGAHQTSALGRSSDLVLSNDEVSGLAAGLDADGARALALGHGCATALAQREVDPQLFTTLVDALGAPFTSGPPTFGLAYASDFWACDEIGLPDMLFGDSWALLEGGLAEGGIADARLAYLAKFEMSWETAASRWGSVAEKASSPRARRIAVQRLSSIAQSSQDPAVITYLADYMRDHETTETLGHVMRAAEWAVSNSAGAGAAEVLDGLRIILQKGHTRSIHGNAVCTAARMTREDPGAWASFRESLKGAPLAPRAKAYLENPRPCL
ncbi:M1 family metallopeptidase [Polyangium aurulentum]|uniref:M1 family metallopeptidase n=1 Tax=Polyangium aurulentum TaxID=2567896 RepID=UPI0010AEC650|nr:M1 family aminopeptidase [Polyangium aurulentum]UQA57350.1 aminopeptidase [Polyangium aurulentum]